MGERAGRRIILIGFSTTGKSVVGQAVAARLGWQFVDIDDEIARRAGKSIPDIFALEGEAGFRQRERDVIRKTLRRDDIVVATGGGAVIDADNRDLFGRSGMVLCLEARPETIYNRLKKAIEESGDKAVRPLLEVEDPLARIREIKASRQPLYALADFTVHTDDLPVEQVINEAVRAWHVWESTRQRSAVKGLVPAATVATATESYPVYVEWRLRRDLGKLLSGAGLTGTANLVSDEKVFAIYGREIGRIFKEAGHRVNSLTLPAGEATKSFASAMKIYDFLVGKRVERGDFILALGGGVISDLAGFAAATYLRGISFAIMPTSLVGMVDASVGGKVAVNHPQGKNLIGAFYQPRLVMADVQTLTTLPEREFRSGWAEVIKHGLILDAALVDHLQESAGHLLALNPEALTAAISRSAAIKAAVVSQDEKETGIRTLLNYGHTIAHGLEAANGYKGLLHSEAVAIGMTGAALISQKLGLLSAAKVRRQRQLLEKFGLPVSVSGIDADAVLKAMELDKKVRNKSIRWVLLTDIGQAVVRNDVPREVVHETVSKLVRS